MLVLNFPRIRCQARGRNEVRMATNQAQQPVVAEVRGTNPAAVAFMAGLTHPTERGVTSHTDLTQYLQDMLCPDAAVGDVLEHPG
ncbi:hypothetical protein PI125_g22733 [Phytophthora idaei]|nr:hypothetical protein PI125_g22733 [Phytophthora idaei]